MKLSNEIEQLLLNKRGSAGSEFKHLIGKQGYISPDSELLENVVAAVALGKNVLLKGPTGSGKTKLAETISYLFNKPMQMINCSVDLDAESMLGFKTIEHSEGRQRISFVPGPVTKAMENGHFLYIDEVNMAKPETLPILNGVLDYRRSVLNPFTQELIIAEKSFNVIAAINEGYIGTTPLNEALKNRFVIVDVPYLQDESLRNLLKENSLLKNEEMLSFFVSLSKDIITGVNQGKVSEDAASIRALMDACDLSVYLPVERAVEISIIGKAEDEREKAFIRNSLEMLL